MIADLIFYLAVFLTVSFAFLIGFMIGATFNRPKKKKEYTLRCGNDSYVEVKKDDGPYQRIPQSFRPGR